MNGLDWAVVVTAAAGTVLGYSRGLIGQLVSFAGFIVAWAVAFIFYDDAAPLIKDVLALSGKEAFQQYEYLASGLHLDTYVYNALAFILLFFVVKLALAVLGRLLNWLASAPGLKRINQLSGAALGLIEATLLVLLAIHALTVIPREEAQGWLKHSRIAPYVLEHTPLLTGRLQELWEKRKNGSGMEAKAFTAPWPKHFAVIEGEGFGFVLLRSIGFYFWEESGGKA